MADINPSRKKRHGPEPVDNPRIHCVSSRLNDEELAQLDAQRGDLKRGEYLRCAALDQLPTVTTIPELNQKAWVELSRAASNLNQLAKKAHIDTDDKTWIELNRTLKAFRSALIGAKL